MSEIWRRTYGVLKPKDTDKHEESKEETNEEKEDSEDQSDRA